MAVYFPKQNILFVHVPKTGGCFVYEVLTKNKDAFADKENVGYQHSPATMCGKEIYFKQPHVFIWQRGEADWFRSYHRWRCKGGDMDVPGYPYELWHPMWELETIFDRDYEVFIERVNRIFPDYFQKMMGWYKDWPFEMTIYDFYNFNDTMVDFFARVGLNKSLRYFDRIGKINAS